jgi:ubiquinone/menaquinone biosynthesis C-methylase UbiE
MHKNPVISYYHSFESKLGYRLLDGVKHFGYYPEGKEGIPTLEAQELMDEQLAAELALPEGSEVLDAGCGEGSVAMYLARHHKLNVTGVDLLDFNIVRAKKEARRQGLDGQLNFVEADYSNTGLPKEIFDAVYTMETLVHSPDYEKTLAEFHRILKPEGKLVLFEYSMAPQSEMSQEAIAGITKVNKLASMPAFDLFTHGALAKTLAESGFDSVASRDITQRMLPLLKKFERKARIPFKIVSLLNLQDHFVNAMSAIVWSKNTNLFKYNIITAVKARKPSHHR